MMRSVLESDRWRQTNEVGTDQGGNENGFGVLKLVKAEDEFKSWGKLECLHFLGVTLRNGNIDRDASKRLESEDGHPNCQLDSLCFSFHFSKDSDESYDGFIKSMSFAILAG